MPPKLSSQMQMRMVEQVRRLGQKILFPTTHSDRSSSSRQRELRMNNGGSNDQNGERVIRSNFVGGMEDRYNSQNRLTRNQRGGASSDTFKHLHNSNKNSQNKHIVGGQETSTLRNGNNNTTNISNHPQSHINTNINTANNTLNNNPFLNKPPLSPSNLFTLDNNHIPYQFPPNLNGHRLPNTANNMIPFTLNINSKEPTATATANSLYILCWDDYVGSDDRGRERSIGGLVEDKFSNSHSQGPQRQMDAHLQSQLNHNESYSQTKQQYQSNNSTKNTHLHKMINLMKQGYKKYQLQDKTNNNSRADRNHSNTNYEQQLNNSSLGNNHKYQTNAQRRHHTLSPQRNGEIIKNNRNQMRNNDINSNNHNLSIFLPNQSISTIHNSVTYNSNDIIDNHNHNNQSIRLQQSPMQLTRRRSLSPNLSKYYNDGHMNKSQEKREKGYIGIREDGMESRGRLLSGINMSSPQKHTIQPISYTHRQPYNSHTDHSQINMSLTQNNMIPFKERLSYYETQRNKHMVQILTEEAKIMPFQPKVKGSNWNQKNHYNNSNNTNHKNSMIKNDNHKISKYIKTNLINHNNTNGYNNHTVQSNNNNNFVSQIKHSTNLDNFTKNNSKRVQSNNSQQLLNGTDWIGNIQPQNSQKSELKSISNQILMSDNKNTLNNNNRNKPSIRIVNPKQLQFLLAGTMKKHQQKGQLNVYQSMN